LHMQAVDLLRRYEGAQISLTKLLVLLDPRVSVLPYPPGVPLPVAIFPSVRYGEKLICGTGPEFWRAHGLTERPWALSYVRNGFAMSSVVGNIPCIALTADTSVVLWVVSAEAGEYWTWDYAKWIPDDGANVYIVTSDVLHRWLLRGGGKSKIVVVAPPKRPVLPYPIAGTLRRVGQAYVLEGQIPVYLYPTSQALYLDFAPWIPLSLSKVCERYSCLPDVTLRIYYTVDEFVKKYGRNNGDKSRSEEPSVDEEGEGGVAEDYGVEEEPPEEEDYAYEREDGADGEEPRDAGQRE